MTATTTTEMPRTGDWRTHLRTRAARVAARAGAIVGRVRTSRVALASPGAAGAAMIAVGFGLKWGLWLGLIVGGVFALRVDGRI